MSIGPIGTAAGAAGSPLAQTKGAELERAQEEVGAQRRAVYHGQKADAAAGVGEPDGDDHETAERDGDGRREWEDPPEGDSPIFADTKIGTVPFGPPDTRQSKDPSQQSGNLLDLTG